jgi:Protein phosphatase 2C
MDMIKEYSALQKPSFKSSLIEANQTNQVVFTGRKSVAVSIPSQNFKKHARKTSLAESNIPSQELFQKRRPLSSNVFSKPQQSILEKSTSIQNKVVDLKDLLAGCKSEGKKLTKKTLKVKKNSEPRPVTSFLSSNVNTNPLQQGQQQKINSSRFSDISKKLNFSTIAQGQQLGDFLGLLNKQIGEY